MALSGVLRDVVQAALAAMEPALGLAATAGGYMSVYALEILLLVITVVATLPLLRRARSAAPARPEAEATGGAAAEPTGLAVGDPPR
jgi:BCD family chlorophyll transporter-like MFS transporter